MNKEKVKAELNDLPKQQAAREGDAVDAESA